LEALIPQDFSPENSPLLTAVGQKPRLRSTNASPKIRAGADELARDVIFATNTT